MLPVPLWPANQPQSWCFPLRSLRFSLWGNSGDVFPLKSKKLVLPRFLLQIRKLKIIQLHHVSLTTIFLAFGVLQGRSYKWTKVCTRDWPVQERFRVSGQHWDSMFHQLDLPLGQKQGVSDKFIQPETGELSKDTPSRLPCSPRSCLSWSTSTPPCSGPQGVYESQPFTLVEHGERTGFVVQQTRNLLHTLRKTKLDICS